MLHRSTILLAVLFSSNPRILPSLLQAQCPPPPPDRLAFASFRDGMEDIYLMAADGSDLLRVTYDTFPSSEPAWSPDGTRLAYQSRRPFWQVYTILPDGSGEELLTDSLAWSPSWHPSGEAIVFSDGGSVRLIPPEGGASRILTTSDGYNGRPTWLPDASHLVFHSTRTGDPEVFLLDPSTGETRQLTHSPARDFHATPSPDGRFIAFSSDRDGDQEIFVMRVDGSDPVQLTSNDARDWMPAWSPDGEWLAFVTDRDGNEEVYLIRPDGSCPRRLTDNPGGDIFPAWQPRRP